MDFLGIINCSYLRRIRRCKTQNRNSQKKKYTLPCLSIGSRKSMMTAVSEVMRQKDVITTKMVLQRFGELYSLPEEGT